MFRSNTSSKSTLSRTASCKFINSRGSKISSKRHSGMISSQNMPYLSSNKQFPTFRKTNNYQHYKKSKASLNMFDTRTSSFKGLLKPTVAREMCYPSYDRKMVHRIFSKKRKFHKNTNQGYLMNKMSKTNGNRMYKNKSNANMLKTDKQFKISKGQMPKTPISTHQSSIKSVMASSRFIDGINEDGEKDSVLRSPSKNDLLQNSQELGDTSLLVSRNIPEGKKFSTMQSERKNLISALNSPQVYRMQNKQ